MAMAMAIKRRLASKQQLTRITSATFVATLLAMVIGTPLAYALDVPPRPTDIPLVDQTNTLTQAQKQALATRIADERKASGNQVAILMIPSLEDEPLEEYTLKVARGWGIGQKERDSGVLLLIAKDDRRLRIEVGYGLEGALTDIRSGQIIRDRITPQFRQNKYYEGISEGLSGIVAAINGEKDPNLQAGGSGQSDGSERRDTSDLPFELIFFGLLFIPSWLGSMLARTKSWWAGGIVGAAAGGIIALFFGFMVIGLISVIALTLLGLFLDRTVSANYRKHAANGVAPSWWAGGPWIGGGRSNSKGGFGGFGGGSFGGGGSSGSW